MEPLPPRPTIPGSAHTGGVAAAGERARELAEAEVCAAIAFVANNNMYRVLVCGMATNPDLIAELDELAGSVGVVLERRIRTGGGLDVVVRSA
jgi:hypothetical protein